MLHSHTQLTSAAHWVHTKAGNITDTILSILQPLDVLAVRLLLERIAPKPLTAQNKVEFWNIQNLRNIYIKKLRECQSTVDGILRNSPCDTVCDRTSLRWAFSLWYMVLYVGYYVCSYNNYVIWSSLPGCSGTVSEQFKCILNILSCLFHCTRKWLKKLPKELLDCGVYVHIVCWSFDN